MPADQKQGRRPHVLAILVACGLITGCDDKAGQLYSPPMRGDPAQPPAVRIIVPAEGAKFHAHKDIRLLALATPYGTSLGPDGEAAKHYADANKWNFMQDPRDTVSVEFLAGTNRLGSRASGMVSASMRSRHGEAVPMIVGLVGYPAVELIWRNAPAGSYTLTAQATNEKGLATASRPVTITILP
jgi:hypothetical protein